jgi:TonB family protein
LKVAGRRTEFQKQIFSGEYPSQCNKIDSVHEVMKTSLRILLAFFILQLATTVPCRASASVRIYPKWKQDAISAPDPEYPMKAEHLGYQGQGIYRLIINDKTGMADEVKVIRTTGHRELDASAIMTLFNWKFPPGKVKQRDVLIIFELTGWVRGLH